ncbi:MAG TPA: DNA translocase FtsK [Anaerolineaceae bacterium]|nr:DNA translocase FtsK [Anaerolineaceae bacterium]
MRFDHWLDLAVGFITRFGRYGWDLLGVVGLAFALLTLLALTNLSQGTLLTPWANFIKTWLGWGSFLVVAFVGLGGLLALRKRSAGLEKFPYGRLIVLECAALAFLALLSILGGNSLETAASYGGRIGWALAELPVSLGLSPLLRTFLITAFFLILLLVGSGVPHLLAAWIERLAQVEPSISSDIPNIPFPGAETANSANISREEIRAAVTGVPVGKKPPPQLPPEFRKSFRVDASEAERPLAPRPRDERLPPLTLLASEQSMRPDEKNINLTAGLIEKTMAEFGIPAKVVGFRIGPTVTQFAVEPGFVEKPGPDGKLQRQKVRVSQISTLSRDLAMALSAERLRIEAPVPGRSYVGIEVPNVRSSVVRLRPILETDAFNKINSPLAIALGRDVSGHPVVADLARMPHLLIAGTTGSGKSVCIAAVTACLVANNTPDQMRVVMIDPKMVELVRFNGLPHLLGKVETDIERILGVLRWTLGEMDHRYRLLEQARVRDISTYNARMGRRKQPVLPRIVLLVDELADLMMSAPDQTEHSLVRLAQMARAVGIHLVVATQRPSTDVVTGLIKANFPARISFTVASSIDSRVILDTPGAETLLGRGDMLFLNPEVGAPQRAQGVYVTDQEIEALQQFWQKALPTEAAAPWESLMNEDEEGGDELVERAIAIIRGSKRASTSLLQRRLRIGYPRAARLMDQLEDLGVVGPSQGGGRDREVLIEAEDGEEREDESGEEAL